MPKAILKVGKAVLVAPFKLLAGLFGLKIPRQKDVRRPYKQAVAPRRSAFGRVKVGGPYALYEAVDKDSVDVVALLQGRSEGVVQAYLNDDKVDVAPGGGVTCPEDDRKYGADRVSLFWRLGLATETAYSQVTAILPSWDAAHRGDTVTSLALICHQAKSSKQNERFPNGLPEPSLVLDAQWVFDPRDEAQVQGDRETYAYSRNPALCLLAFLTDAEGGMGLDYDRLIAPQLSSWIAAADDCDAAEATIDGTEARYACGGAYDHDTAPGEVIKALLSTFDGVLDPDGRGGFVLHPGRYQAPAVTITDRMVQGYTLESALADEQAANVLVIRYTDPDADFNEGDAGEVRDEDDIEARGKERAETFDLDWVQSRSQAVRLALRRLSQATRPLRGTLTLNMMGLVALGERYLTLQIADHPLLADLVVERTGAIEVDVGKQALSFAWVSAQAAIDDGDPGATTPQPGAPDPRPSPDPLAAPAIAALSALYESSGAGVAGARIVIEVTAPIDADVDWLARWRVAGESPPGPWHEAAYSDIDDGAAVTLVTGFVPASGDVEVEVAYRTAGATSPWSATETITLAAPAASTSLIAGESITAPALVNVYDAAGTPKVRKADATAAGKAAHGFILASVTVGNPAAVQFEGTISGLSALVAGDVWLATTAGGVTQTAPSASGNVVQLVGRAVSATAVDFEAGEAVELT